MTTPRILLGHRSLGVGGFSTFGACAVFLLIAYSHPDSRAMLSAQSKVANPITGEGLPNPAPKVTRNWGELPAGRKGGTSAGLDIGPQGGDGCGGGRRGRWCRLGGRRGGWPLLVRPRPCHPRLQVCPPHRQGAGELRQGRDG